MTDRQAWVRAIEIIVAILSIVVCACLIGRWFVIAPGASPSESASSHPRASP